MVTNVYNVRGEEKKIEARRREEKDAWKNRVFLRLGFGLTTDAFFSGWMIKYRPSVDRLWSLQSAHSVATLVWQGAATYVTLQRRLACERRNERNETESGMFNVADTHGSVQLSNSFFPVFLAFKSIHLFDNEQFYIYIYILVTVRDN